jgi:hypothetical protein
LSSPSPYIDASRCSIVFFYLLIYIIINNQCVVQTINIVALLLHSLMLPPSVAGVRQLPTRGLCRLANRSYQLLVTSLRHVDVFGLSIRSHSDSYSRQDMLSHDRWVLVLHKVEQQSIMCLNLFQWCKAVTYLLSTILIKTSSWRLYCLSYHIFDSSSNSP